MGAAASQDTAVRANVVTSSHPVSSANSVTSNSAANTTTANTTTANTTAVTTTTNVTTANTTTANVTTPNTTTVNTTTANTTAVTTTTNVTTANATTASFVDNSTTVINNGTVPGNQTEPLPTPAPAAAPKQKVKTLEDYKEIEKNNIEHVNKCFEIFDEHYPNGNRDEVNDAIYIIRRAYSKLSGAPPELITAHRNKLANIITEHGKFVSIVCETIIKILTDKNYYSVEGDETGKKVYSLLDLCLVSMLNYSDCSDLMKNAFGKNEAIVKLISEKLVEWWPPHQAKSLTKEDESITKRLIGISHNLAMLESNVASMRNHGYVMAVVPYLNSWYDMHKLSAVATLADIVNEDECDLLNSNEDSIKFLLKKLGNASKNVYRRDAGWSAAELGRTVGRLARNDGNKKLLVTLGCLPLLLELAASEVKIEQEESIESLWVLAFDEDNKIKMVNEPNLIDVIEKLEKSAVGKVKKLCNGIIWTLQKTLQGVEKYSHIVKTYKKTPGDEFQLQKEKAKQNAKDQSHVMISYQWANQNTLKAISASLREDRRQVWMDIDDMEGSTVQAMASAIESAKVVIICISQKYKDSPNCRAEAEYAFQLRRPIIPLIMETGYRADGWLGFIVGAKLFYDFSGKYSFESRIEGLIKAVKQMYDPSEVHDGGPKVINPQEPVAMDEVDSPVTQKQKVVPLKSARLSTLTDDEIEKWTTQEVGLWLKKHNLKGNQHLNKLSGKEIIFLRDLREEAPEFFYHTLESKLGLQHLNSLVDFSRAIQNLVI